MELKTDYDLHKKIQLKLDYFIKTNKIPHILFIKFNKSVFFPEPFGP